MIRQDNPELRRKVLNHLADLYKIREIREPNHLSSYITCRTKSFLNQKGATEPTDEEIMLFVTGYGLQDVLTPKDAEVPTMVKHGIIYSPDMILSVRLSEIKTTRRSAKNHAEALPETWMDYMLGGCYMMECNEYDLIVLYLMGNYAPPFPEIICDTIVFEKEEIEENWKKILQHKEALDTALATGKAPTPYQHCYDWECKYCRHKMLCEVIVRKEASG